MNAPVADQPNHFQPAATTLHQPNNNNNNSSLRPDGSSLAQTSGVSVKAEPATVKEEFYGSQVGPSSVPAQGVPDSQQGRELEGGPADLGEPPNSSAPGTSQPGEAGHAVGGLGQDQGAAQGKQVSTNDIQRVQNYIEKCLQCYLSQKEVIMQLQQQFKIEPCFTQLVWQKLEEQNQEFFRAYYTRLKLKDQIILFNHLLDEQVKMYNRMPGRAPAMAGMQMQQPRPGGPGYSQQMAPGAVHQQGGMQLASVPASAGFASQMPAESASQPAQLNADPSQLHIGEFPGMGIDGAAVDLPPDLAGIGQSLPFSGSEINLAGMVSLGSPGRNLLGAPGDHVDLSGLPRNFSLSDLALDQVNDGDHGLPHSISLSDLPALDLDSGGEQG